MCLILPLLLQGTETSKLLLLRNYLFGFDITWIGAAIGMLQLGIIGFAFGFLMAHTINYIIQWHERRLFRKLELMEALAAEPSEPFHG